MLTGARPVLTGAWAKLLKPCVADDIAGAGKKKTAACSPQTGEKPMSKIARMEKADERKMKADEKAKEKGTVRMTLPARARIGPHARVANLCQCRQCVLH